MTTFISRQQCTDEGLRIVQQRLADNRVDLANVTDDLSIFNTYLEFQQNAQDNVFDQVCAARAKAPTRPVLSIANLERTRLFCERTLDDTVRFIRSLEHRRNEINRMINRDLAEESAIRFGRNYARLHADEFVIYLMEQGHILQLTNPFYPSRFSATNEPPATATQTPTAAPPPPTFGPMRKKHTPSKRPRDKRSNVLTNELDVSLHFDVVSIDHAFQMADLLKHGKNMLIVFPDNTKIFRSLTKLMDNNFIVMHDSIKGYYTSGKFDTLLVQLTSDYFRFTTALERSSIHIDFKKQFIIDLNDFIRQQISSDLRWYYYPRNAIEDVKTKIVTVTHNMYSIKI
jgi:hypothetical protein